VFTLVSQALYHWATVASVFEPEGAARQAGTQGARPAWPTCVTGALGPSPSCSQ
jgi:hypothetical protein